MGPAVSVTPERRSVRVKSVRTISYQLSVPNPEGPELNQALTWVG